ncbi:NAD-dependent protein deacetylase hst1 [Lachnellula suecica]|uniref:NAD-dependent protein deacetylase hst1 n=1 Tax=Lachnellula suecica TaxID=602035 RepID=A0A8T9C136_9HELO|nr:NAD-dependent protein deacetylase hst1 [Lachnellula suecica]
MDVAMSRVGSMQTAINDVASYQLVGLSDSDGSKSPDVDALAALPRVNGVNMVQEIDASDDGSLEDSDDDDDLSAFEGTLGEMDDQHLFAGDPEACTYDEAIQYRNDLRTFGPAEFCARTVEAGAISAKKLLTAFNIKPPAFLKGASDDAYYSLLSLGISRELSKRIKLPQYNTIEDAVDLIKKSKNIIVLTGAGISTSLGIPDFRSKNGLYSMTGHLGLDDPQDLFSLEIFKEDPALFYSFAHVIIQEHAAFSPTHAFIHLLQQKGKLLTNYTQNIDNIEQLAGILPEKLIQCHGSFATASCIRCKHQVEGVQIYPDIRAKRIPRCDKCIASLRNLKVPNGMKRKRSQNGTDKKRRRFDSNSDSEDEEDFDIPEAGVMKPDITFFGEPLPDIFSERLTNHDKDKVDLVIVIGTSLKVAPVSEVVPYLPSNIPQMYISRDPVSHVNFDIDLLGDADVVVAELCRRLDWELNHDMVPKDKFAEVTLQEGFTSRHRFTIKQ